MANSGPHLLVGGVVGLAATIFLKHLRNERLTLWEGIGGALIGSFGALLPDFFEPASNPSHRKFLHSKTLGGAGIPLLLSKIYEESWPSRQENRDFLFIILFGYLSHLVLDGRTPKGLPLL